MKVLVIVLACVIGMAWGQGRSITNSVNTQQSNTATNTGINAFPLAPITNPRTTTCGQFSSVCFGRGLESRGALYVFPQAAQCQARIAQKYGYLLRIDFNGMMMIVNKFGELVEDIEPAPINEASFGFGIAGQQRALAAQQQAAFQELQLENMQLELEFCQSIAATVPQGFGLGGQNFG
ncbi:unnamed protein product, partial [Meganyctiphanes norvegica]